MASFNATDPVPAVAGGLYVPPPGVEVAARIAARAELEPDAAQVLIGGIGHGKTTQLLRVRTLLGANPELVVRYVEVGKRHHLGELRVGVLSALAGLQLAAELSDRKDAEIETAKESIRSHAIGWWGQDGDDFEPDDGTVWRPGVLVPPAEDALPFPLEMQVRALVTALAPRRMIVLFDGLDRIAETAPLVEILRRDVAAMRREGIGTVIVGPERLLFGDARALLDRAESWHYLPAIDVASEAGVAFMASVLRARADAEILPDDVARRLVTLSGGIMRDLIVLARAAGDEAYMSGAEAITEAAVGAAADRMGRQRIFGLTREELEVLQRVRRSGEFVETSDRDVQLLVTGRVIQYARPHSRYAVHPTLEPLLRHLGRAA